MMRPMKKIAFTSIALTASLALSACGGSSVEDYCDELEDVNEQVSEFQDGDFSSIEEVSAVFSDLGDKAPSEVEDDWATMEEAITLLEEGLDEVGLTMDDLEALSEGDIPENFDMTKMQEFGEKMEELDDPRFDEAGDNIAEHAEAECGIDLGN